MKQASLVRGSAFRRAAFIIFVFAAAMIVPFYFGSHSGAQTHTGGTYFSARLTGAAINGQTPRGTSSYLADSNNNRVLETQVSNVNLPTGTMLGVFVNDTSAGQIRLSSMKSGTLRLSSSMGQTVPTVAEGSTIEVRNGSTVVLSGIFALPPTPSPSPTRSASPSPSATRTPYPTPTNALFAPLSGATIDGVMPRGLAQYGEYSSSRKLGVFVGHVRLPEGTTLSVLVNSTVVGQITLDDDGDGGLRLDSANGDAVPTIVTGDTATVKNGETVIVSGTFRAFTTSPSPSPSPSPSGSPTPNPTPRPNRFFGGRLNGDQVVPPVTTTARGLVGVLLNQTETQIRVEVGFRNLSSAQTTATINGPAMIGETAPVAFDLGTVGGTSGRISATFSVTAEQVEQLRNGLWYVQIGSVNNPTGEIRGQIRSHTRRSNFGGDETEDIAVFRPSTGTWYVQEANGLSAKTLGQNGDVPVSGDFDGDGKSDNAVFRNGTWLISRSSDGGLTTKQFGMTGDIPTRGDYDGDGNADIAVFRPSTGVWYIEKSNGSGHTILQFGANGDIPVASDFDGDSRTDIAVFRPSSGVWYWVTSSRNEIRAVQFGMNGDAPIAGDFDGDGADDLAVYRPSTGVWYAWRSSNGTFDIRQFGASTDVPVAGNYDGDGVADIAVFRPSTGTWYIWRSSDNTFDYRYFGTNGDIPTTKH